MLSNEVALVTGASRGIGAAIASRLSIDGARVIGTATTAQGASRISEALSAYGGRGAVLDVTSQDSIDALISDIESHEGAVGILCNNAGITRDTLLLRMKPEDWDAVMQTNLASVFRLSKAVLRGMMKARRGRIISIASIVGLTGNPGEARNDTAAAMSSGWPNLPSGTWPLKFVRCASVSARVMSVSMNPGAMTFAVMLREPTSRASDLVKPMMPALAAA